MTATNTPSLSSERTSPSLTPVYFPRRLSPANGDAEDEIDEDGLLNIPGARVVLGEPGMGKSELLSELGRRIGVEPVSAIRFVSSRNPGRFVTANKPLLIDGLDEAIARREGDAVDAVLAQLEDAGAPPFILSCRSREWQARGESNLRQIYGADPRLFSIEPLRRAEASRFLTVHYSNADAEHVLSHLDAHGLSELYRNPLTLGLMGRVAEAEQSLPASRGALFERVCTLIWPEHNGDRQDEILAQLGEAEALSAAGAICAALLFGGSEAATVAGAAMVRGGDIRIVDVARLPGASVAAHVFNSKLFKSLGSGRAKPIHRVVSEYLAARWLAGITDTPRKQRRLLAQLHGSGAVPSSLRGLHAWLAYHSATLAEHVISADPYGVLRYGEAAALSRRQAELIFEALEALTRDDPWFRSGDWDVHTAAGLMVPALQRRIDRIIGSENSNPHLRSLLIEGLDGSPMACELADTLADVLLSPKRFYRERLDAAKALLPHRERNWWRDAIRQLTEAGGEDAGHLARALVELIGGDVSDELLVAAVFAELELLVSLWPRVRKRRVHTVRHFGGVAAALPSERLPNVLDTLVSYARLLSDDDWAHAKDLADLSSALITRAINENVAGPNDGARLWSWLGIVSQNRRYYRESHADLLQSLRDHPEVRRAAQEHALYGLRRRDQFWIANCDLAERFIGLGTYEEDVVWFLNRLSGADNKDKALRSDWRDLMQMGHDGERFRPGVLEASKAFMRDDKQLAATIIRIENPKIAPWQKRQASEAAKRERKQRVVIEEDRRSYEANRANLRAGQLGWIHDPARAYLGHLSDLPHAESAIQRLELWLGPNLAVVALTGFEATLHRTDIPSPTEISRGFGDNVTYNFSFPILAGLAERQRTGLGFIGVSHAVLTIGLMLVHDGGWGNSEAHAALEKSLKAILLKTQIMREDYARTLIEPSLASGSSHVTGLYRLAHEDEWIPTGGALAEGWLLAYPLVPENVEAAVIDCLTHAGELEALRRVAIARSHSVFRSYDHLLTWLAVDILVRFEDVAAALTGIGSANPEFIWFLRNRFQLERRGAMLSVSIAQASWILREFRTLWPYATLAGTASGDRSDFDATDFLRALINRIANDPSNEASAALSDLISQPEDSYTDTLMHMAAEQRQKQAEERFVALQPGELVKLLTDGTPANIDDLKALVVEELNVAARKLIGDDIDEVRDFWTDGNVPRDENRCRDRLAGMIGLELMRYGIQRITEADMPATKRADLAFACGTLQLPLEVKGQWHPEVWDAADGQLEARYLIDWRSEQRGIYCVLWFGDLPSKTGRRLKAPPDGASSPKSAGEMAKALSERIPPARRTMIDVIVLDCTAGKHVPR